MIDDCSFCRCHGVSCFQGVKMIEYCSFCRCRVIVVVGSSVRIIDDCLFCRCRGLSCVQGVMLGRQIIVCFVDVAVLLVFRDLG